MSFTAKITADITKFEQNIGKAIDSTNKLENTVSAKLSKMGDSFVSVGKKASILSAAVGAAAVAAVAFAKKTGDMANDLLSATIALDSSADILQEYKLVSIEAGTSTDAFSRSVESLTRRLKEAEGDGDDVTEYIQRLGVSLFDSSGEMRRMGDITDDLIKSLAGMENIAQRNIIASQLFGRQWVSIAPILALGADGIDEVRRNAHDLGVVLDGDALNAANKFSIEMNKMQLQLQAVKDRLASEIAPVLSETLVPILEGKVVPAIGEMAEGLGDIADKFNNLPDQTKEVILAIGGIAVAIGPVLLGIGAILKTLPLIAAGFAAITGPIGLAIGAIVTMIANIPRVLRNVVEGFKIFAENIKMIFNALFSLLKGDVDSFFGAFQNQFGKNIGWAKDQIDGLRDKWDKLKSFLGFGGRGEDVEPAWYAANKMTGSSGAAEVLTREEKIIASLNKQIEDLKKKLGELSDKAKETASDTTTAISNIVGPMLVIGTEQAEKFIDKLFSFDGNKMVLKPLVEPTIDTESLRSKMYESVKSAMGDLTEGIKVLTIDLSSMLGNALTDVFGSVADAMMNGDNMMATLGASLLGTLGGIMVQLGEMVIATGSAIEAVKAALSSLGGIGAIAAGVALIAIGSLFKSGASKLSRSMGSGGGYSSAPSMGNTSPSYGPSEYRGAYQDDFKVEFKIGTNELVGVLNTAEQRRIRI